MGMVGGSLEGFIGSIHRLAAALDGKIILVAGCFSSQLNKSFETGKSLNLSDDRIYTTIEEMIFTEKKLPLDVRIEFISIVTPNHLHFEAARLALSNGFHVLCEKPVTFNLDQALELQKLTSTSGLLFGLTHNYTGYPMIKEAKNLVGSGAIGKVRKIIAEYPQGWLSSNLEKSGQRQASWRMDPDKAGISCCVADIGTHAENLLEYITGLQIAEVAADINSFVSERVLEDDANILIRLTEGAKGVIIASQIASGDENELRIRIYGENGGLEWLQSNPNHLHLKNADGSVKILKSGIGNQYLSLHARAHTRLPGGHPEGYIESMANIYRNFALAVELFSINKTYDNKMFDFPTIHDGVRGMRFIEAVIESGKDNSRWVKL